MATDKKSRDTMVFATVIIALIVTVMVNLLADKRFARIDLTSERRYSLSEPFQNILGRLKDPAKVTYYVSAQVPGWFESFKRDILDKLSEIKTASRGKIDLEVVDPSDNKELSERLQQSGARHEVQEVKKEQMNVSLLFTGLEITYQDKPKVLIPAVGRAEEIEYLLGSKIIELTLEKKPVIAIQAPPAPQQPPMMMGRQQQQGSGYEWLEQGSWDDSKKFDVKAIDITESKPIPPDAKLLVLIRPKDLNERQRYEVIKYLAGGGKVLLIASPFKTFKEFGWRTEKTPTGLEDYLGEIGISFGPDFIADNSNLRMPTSINIMSGKVEYARNQFFVKILGENIDQESVLTRLMPGLLMPIPAEVRLDEDKLKKNGLAQRVLAKTSKQSWRVPYRDTFDPEKDTRYDENLQVYDGSKNVFIMAEGQFPFPYEGKAVPEWNKSSEPPAADGKADKDKKSEVSSAAPLDKKPGSLLVCSCPEAFHLLYLSNEQLGQQMQGNASLIVNISESVSLGDDLIKLRTKRYETRAIDKLSGSENDNRRNVIKLALIAGVPLLVILFAMLRYFMRRSTQVRYERKFAKTIGPSSFTQ